MNTHLASITQETRDFHVELDGSKANLSGGSDDVKEGRYLLRVVDASALPNKNMDGVNIKLAFMIIGPEGCSEMGKSLIAQHPVPIGDGDLPEIQRKGYYLTAMVKSAADLQGAAFDGLQDISRDAFVNQVTAAYIVSEDNTKGTNVGKIKAYLLKSTYDTAPGPVDNGSNEGMVQTAQVQAQVDQQAQLAQQAQAQAAQAQAAQAAQAQQAQQAQAAQAQQAQAAQTTPPAQTAPAQGAVASFLGGGGTGL